MFSEELWSFTTENVGWIIDVGLRIAVGRSEIKKRFELFWVWNINDEDYEDS